MTWEIDSRLEKEVDMTASEDNEKKDLGKETSTKSSTLLSSLDRKRKAHRWVIVSAPHRGLIDVLCTYLTVHLRASGTLCTIPAPTDF